MATWVDMAIEKTRGFARTGALVACAISALMAASPGAAQSPYGCEDLENLATPMAEGLDGMFFRIVPDLLMDTRLSTGTIDEVARLSRALESRGTTLAYVPIPTKGLVLADHLGSDAVRYGFDGRLAGALFADTIAELRSKDVVTVDVVAAFGQQRNRSNLFFGADPRMTDTGLRVIADAVREELGADHIGTTEFGTTAGRKSTVASRDRFLLQLACQATLPNLNVPRFSTRQLETSKAETGRPAVVVSSHITSGSERNLSGFLSQQLRRRVAREVRSDTAYDALASYLTSEAYRKDQPELIIWLVPIWENPARFGDQPMRELSAAAADRCSGATEMARSGEGRFKVDARGLRISDATSVRIDTGGAPMSRAVIRFTSAAGEVRARSITRRDPNLATSRMYLPLSGLWPDGVAEIAIESDAESATPPMIAVCRNS